MTCLACHRPALARPSAHGLCVGCAFLFLLGPCASVGEFLLLRSSHAPRNSVEYAAREEA
jgi:hypothetical protein